MFARATGHGPVPRARSSRGPTGRDALLRGMITGRGAPDAPPTEATGPRPSRDMLLRGALFGVGRGQPLGR